LARRAALIENIVYSLWKEHIESQSRTTSQLAVVALGGFGRSWLFPYSDIDLLFLHETCETEASLKDAVRSFSQELWDLT
jgi:[protein-PII] uridylyltransferase